MIADQSGIEKILELISAGDCKISKKDEEMAKKFASANKEVRFFLLKFLLISEKGASYEKFVEHAKKNKVSGGMIQAYINLLIDQKNHKVSPKRLKRVSAF